MSDLISRKAVLDAIAKQKTSAVSAEYVKGITECVEKIINAPTVAIKALEDKTDLQPTCNNLATNLQVDTPTNTPTDLISRKDAIDAINTWDKFGVDERGRAVRWHEGLIPYVHLRDVLTAIVNLPSAQPVTTNEITLYDDGTLWVTVEDCGEVNRVIVDEYNERFCRTFYMDETR